MGTTLRDGNESSAHCSLSWLSLVLLRAGYYCNCNANVDAVTVTITSDDLYTTYDLNFEDATKVSHMQQYLALGQESNQMHFTATPTATPSYANTVVISPACSDCRSTYTVSLLTWNHRNAMSGVRSGVCADLCLVCPFVLLR